MRNCRASLAMMIFAITCSAPVVRAQEESAAKESPFQETAVSVLSGGLLYFIEYGHFPHFLSYDKMKGRDFDAALHDRIHRFPDELLKVLADPNSPDNETAIMCLAYYACFARAHAAQLREKDLATAVDWALAPYTEKIQKGLVAGLDAKKEKTRVFAAVAILARDERHVRANDVLRAAVRSDDVETLMTACNLIGVARLNSPQGIAYLRFLMKHPKKEAREAAAGAAITLGPEARALTPDLIEMYKAGKNAVGVYYYPFALAGPQQGNLALMALEGLKEHVEPAIPLLVGRFDLSSDEEQIATLACLANVGQTRATYLTARKAVGSGRLPVKLAAACALLRIGCGGADEAELLKKALLDNATRTVAFESCQRFGPPSREIVAILISLLGSDEEDVRIQATFALGCIGTPARAAVPAITKLLARDDDHMKHTFRSVQVAAQSLAKIGGKEATAALSRVAGANSETTNPRFAMMYLTDVTDDLPPATLDVLVGALKGIHKDGAAMALSNLGERARPVRRHLEEYGNDPDIGWIIDTALRRIPANPRDR